MIDSLTRAMIYIKKKGRLPDVYTERKGVNSFHLGFSCPACFVSTKAFLYEKERLLATGNRLNDPLWAAISLLQMKKNLESLDRSTSSLLYLRPK